MMDTSSEYVKMRLAAVPYMGIGNPLMYPIHSPSTGVEGVFNTLIWTDSKMDWYAITQTETVQLERQDQLQEMVHSTDWISTFEKFVLWAFRPDPMKCEIYYGMGIPHDVFSMEQLWLAFVMQTLYHKTWQNGEWK